MEHWEKATHKFTVYPTKLRFYVHLFYNLNNNVETNIKLKLISWYCFATFHSVQSCSKYKAAIFLSIYNQQKNGVTNTILSSMPRFLIYNIYNDKFFIKLHWRTIVIYIASTIRLHVQNCDIQHKIPHEWDADELHETLNPCFTNINVTFLQIISSVPV